MERRVAGTWRTLRFVTDRRGSVRCVVDADNGEVLHERRYDPYGQITYDTDPDATLHPFGYAGGLYDPITGLVRFGARDYDPTTARWTTPDPIQVAGGTNLFRYANNDPVNWVDPSGLLPLNDPPHLAASGVAPVDASGLVGDFIGGAWTAAEYATLIAGGAGILAGAAQYIGKKGLGAAAKDAVSWLLRRRPASARCSASKGGGKADDVFHVTPDGVALPKGPKWCQPPQGASSHRCGAGAAQLKGTRCGDQVPPTSRMVCPPGLGVAGTLAG